MRSLADALPLLVAYVDRDQRFLFVNSAYEHWFGAPRAAIEGRSVASVLGPAAYAAMRRHVEAALRGETVVYENTADYRAAGPRRVLVTYVPQRDERGDVVGFYSLVQDITEKKQLESSVHHHARLVESTFDGIISTDLSRVIRTWNKAAERLYGWSREEVVGKVTPQELLHSRYPHSELSQVLATLAEQGHWQGEVIHTRRDGEQVHVRASVSWLLDDLGRRAGTVAVTRDITDVRRLEAELQHAQKMEAIGQLASGVAHDFSNLLMGIIGFADVALTRMGPRNEGRPYLLELKRAALGGTALVGQLLSYARREPAEPGIVDVHAVLNGMAPMLRQLLGADVVLTLALDASTFLVRCDAGQIEQIVMNLVVNARRAMPRGGALSISTSGNDKTLALRVVDTGVGMDAATLSRIFEPFFTTRSSGEGTGLGLSMVRDLVRRMDGRVEAESTPGVGTTFAIALPVCAGQAPAPESSGARAVPSGDGTVLVVEDDPLVRSALRHYLESGGYHVLEAADAREAREHCRRTTDIGLLLVDMVLPGTSGDRLAADLTALQPGSAVLFISAHPRPLLAERGLLPAEARALQKPFDATALLLAVHEALERRSPAAASQAANVLLVEDQEMSRIATRELLEDMGYTVFDAPDAARALEIASDPDQRIDIVVTDVNLPDMQGTELVERVRADRTAVCALFVSGLDAADADLQHALAAPVTAFARKPIDIDNLEQQMRVLLRARS